MDDNLENKPQKNSEKKNENAIKPNLSDKPKVETTSSASSLET